MILVTVEALGLHRSRLGVPRRTSTSFEMNRPQHTVRSLRLTALTNSASQSRLMLSSAF